MKNFLLIITFVSMLFLAGCGSKQQENENWIEYYNNANKGIAYYDANSLNKVDNIVTCKVKRTIISSNISLSYVTNNYEIDYENKTITRTNTVSVEKNGKKYIVKEPSTESFSQYNKRNKDENIVKTMAQYYKLENYQ